MLLSTFSGSVQPHSRGVKVIELDEPPLPKLFVDKTVARDLEGLAARTWILFLEKFAARTDCFGDVTLSASLEMNERARYYPQTATIKMRVPAYTPRLQGALVHEWAHHVEHQCAEQAEMRAAFLATQGFPPDAEWRSGSSWKETPAEHFAEAVIVYVLGSRINATGIVVPHDSVQIIAEWAQGE